MCLRTTTIPHKRRLCLVHWPICNYTISTIIFSFCMD